MANYYIKSQGLYNALYNFYDQDVGDNEIDGFDQTEAHNGYHEIVEEIGIHKRAVLHYVGPLPASLTLLYTTFDPDIDSGVFECYIRSDDVTAGWETYFQDSLNNFLLGFYMTLDKFQYYDGATNDVGLGASNNTWYHISICFNNSGGVTDPHGDADNLADGKWRVYINSVKYGDYNLANNVDLDKITFGGFNNGDSGYNSAYSSSIGWDWDAAYDVGDNLSLAANTDITSIVAMNKIIESMRKVRKSTCYINGATIEDDDKILVKDIYTSYRNAHPNQNGYIYKSSAKLRGQTIGSFPTTDSYCTWTDYDGASCETILIDKYNGHAYVLQLKDEGGATAAGVAGTCGSGNASGSFEIWLASIDCTKECSVLLYDEGLGVTAGVRIDADLWYYFDGGWQAMGGTAPVDSKWYRITFTFNCSTEKYDIAVVDEDDTAISSTSDADMASSPTTVNYFYIGTQNGDSDYLVFTGGIGWTWDSTYTLGDNANYDTILSDQEIFEGILTKNNKEYLAKIDLIGEEDSDLKKKPEDTISADQLENMISQLVTDNADHFTAEEEDEIYRGSLTFENDTDGVFPMGWIDLSTGGAHTVITVDATGVGNHTYVLKLNDTDAVDRCRAHYFFESQENGTIEFWIRSDDATLDSRFTLEDAGGNQITGFRIDNDNWYYYEEPGGGAAWTDPGGNNPADDTWYRVRIDFECGDGEYTDAGGNTLGADEASIYIYNEAGTELDKAEGYTFGNTTTAITHIEVWTEGADTGYITYFDAIGFSWDEDYTIGDNQYIWVKHCEVSAYGTPAKGLTLNKDKQIANIISTYADMDFYSWYFYPDLALRWGLCDDWCGISLSSADKIGPVKGTYSPLRINKVVTIGGFNADPARVYGSWDDTDGQSTYGVKVLFKFATHLIDEDDLDQLAEQIGTRESQSPTQVELWMSSATYGLIQYGETIYIPADTIQFSRNTEYIEAGYWLMTDIEYNPITTRIKIKLSNGIVADLDEDKAQELEKLINQ